MRNAFIPTTRDQQRRRHVHKLMLSIQLHSHLNNLMREILAGDASQLPEFQQYIQYAPPEMRDSLLRSLHATNSN